MQKLNTHYYDCKLKYVDEIVVKVVINIDDVNLINVDIKIVSFEDTLDEIKIYSKNIIDISNILSLLKNDRKNNYDSKNNINFENLLTYTWNKLKYMDDSIKKLFIEQLSDISKGSCSQGRTTKIIQFHNFLEKSL